MDYKFPKWMNLAKKESYKSTYDKHKIGCVAVKGGSILSKGFNQLRHKSIGVVRYAKWVESLHAERDCLSKINKEDIAGCTVYNYRQYANGKPAMSKPCPQCMWMLIELGVRKVVYTIPTFPYYEEINLRSI